MLHVLYGALFGKQQHPTLDPQPFPKLEPVYLIGVDGLSRALGRMAQAGYIVRFQDEPPQREGEVHWIAYAYRVHECPLEGETAGDFLDVLGDTPASYLSLCGMARGESKAEAAHALARFLGVMA